MTLKIRSPFRNPLLRKTDWDITIESEVDIINFDAYFYAQSVGTYAQKLRKFMEKRRIFIFGIVPTLDKEALGR